MRHNPFIQTRETAKAFYLPKDIQTTVITRPGIVAEVHIWTDRQGRPCAVAWHGKANKPDFNEYYRSELYRTNRINQYLDNLQGHALFVEQRKAERQNILDGIEVGTIMVHSWGYDQTNVDFYQVVSRTAKTLTIREIAQQGKDDGFMCGHCTPLKDQFTSPEQVIRSPYRIWDGRPEYYSYYA